MKRHIGLVDHIALFLAMLNGAGCENPIHFEEKIPASSDMRHMTYSVKGDAPFHIECSYGGYLNDLGPPGTTIDTTCTAWLWQKSFSVAKGTHFRLYATSKRPNGRIEAYVSAVSDRGYLLVDRSVKNSGVPVEIIGAVP
jgi:hypothetical protein